MQTTAVMDEGNPPADSDGDGRPLRVVIAYDDLAAGKGAMHVLGDIAKAMGDGIEFEPMPWSFDLLADVDWREVASSEAVKADLLIIASCSCIRTLPSRVGRWTEAAIQSKHGTAAAVVALLGPEENPDGGGSPRLEFIQRAAERAGLDFFAPSPRRDLEVVLADVHRRAELVTPLLAGILEREGADDSSRREVRS